MKYCLPQVGLLALIIVGVTQQSMPAEGSESVFSGTVAVSPDKSSIDPPATQPAPASPSAGLILPTKPNVAIIRIEGMIYDFTLDSIKRRVGRTQSPSVIVFELETPGGVAISAMEISRYIKQLPVPTIAWVHDEAYSAGIMIASSCDYLLMSPASVTGDCAPIVPKQNLNATERAKALSPLLEEFRDNATDNNYDYVLFHAMCVLGVKVYLVEHKDTGERCLINQADYRVMVKGVEPDKADVEIRTGGDTISTDSDGGGVEDISVGQISLSIAIDADRGQWQPVESLPSGATIPGGLVHDGNTLLTLNQTRAADIGLSKAIIANEIALKQYLGANSVTQIPQSWSEDIAGYLTHPYVRIVLIIALLLGAYIEFQTPGVGIAGAIAGIALVGLLGAPFVVGLADVWHVLLFLAGFALLIVELVFVPGFGLLGITGLSMMFAGLVLSIVPTGGGGGFGPIRLPPPEMWDRLMASTLSMMVGLIISFIGFYALTRFFGSIPGLNRLILTNDLAAIGRSVTINDPAEHISGQDAIGHGRIRVADTGVAVTGLRPSGQAEIDGQILDVVTVGNWIEPRRRIKVIEIHGNRIVVDEDVN